MKTDFVNSGYFVDKTVFFSLRNPAIESFIEMDSETRLKSVSVKECRSLESYPVIGGVKYVFDPPYFDRGLS